MPMPKRKRSGKSPRRSRTMKITTAPIINAALRSTSTWLAARFFERSSP